MVLDNPWEFKLFAHWSTEPNLVCLQHSPSLNDNIVSELSFTCMIWFGLWAPNQTKQKWGNVVMSANVLLSVDHKLDLQAILWYVKT
jgi:hypothetical protein